MEDDLGLDSAKRCILNMVTEWRQRRNHLSSALILRVLNDSVLGRIGIVM